MNLQVEVMKLTQRMEEMEKALALILASLPQKQQSQQPQGQQRKAS